MTPTRDFSNAASRRFLWVHLGERIEEDLAGAATCVHTDQSAQPISGSTRRPDLEVAHHFAAIASPQFLQDASLKTRINIFVHEFD